MIDWLVEELEERYESLEFQKENAIKHIKDYQNRLILIEKELKDVKNAIKKLES